ncbi:MAG: bifunctional phosphopantothenoylcysteine decarboxylase/phosphopantothenate--cysteine ligase CoaBC [Microbacteriaceae bacterium]|nr:bifunctional phosphopantothenoylcysteine decarboxylase/phosphopantothenate--cysteine ligase CoaBC [Microbacteriaceae bacterium]
MNIVVGVTGGIAAYKVVSVLRTLVLSGHDVHVVATDAALRFVGKPTLEAISRNVVNTDLYEGVSQVRHVAIGQAADLILVAPATANTIAKLAAGIADDLLGNTLLASRAPVLIAPAMHTEMWHNPATVANVALLRSRGVRFIGPISGQLTGDDSGPGRLAEPDDIVAAVLALIEVTSAERAAAAAVPVADAVPAAAAQDLAGRRVLVTAGGTREALDPVRFLGNRSSGRQGVAIAEAAHVRGAAVTLIGANLEVPVASGITVISVVSATELASAVSAAAPHADLIVMAAAVADYRPETIADRKIKKDTAGDRLTLNLVKNPDILMALGQNRGQNQLIVGFAAETEADDDALVQLARGKIRRKGCDLLVVNRVGWSTGFSTVDNAVLVINPAGDIVMEAAGSKLSLAHRILDLTV